MALVLLLADGEAEIGAVIAAVLALAALRREERDDVIAWRDVRHTVAHALDDTGAFMSQHGRRVTGGIGAGGRVEVGMTHAAGHEPHEHLALLRFGEVELLNHQRSTEFLEDGCPDLHYASIVTCPGSEATRSSHARSAGYGSRSKPPSSATCE